MAVTININGLSLCHKGSGGVAKSTPPDVCKTPMPGGPVPIPYSIISFSKDLVKGTKTIKVDGGNMAANLGSEFSCCIGDEPGTLKGVASGTQLKESTWLTYSPNVFFEDKAACRLSDKMFMNHKNTVCLGGEQQPAVSKTALKKAKEMDCAELLDKINELTDKEKIGRAGTKGLKQRFRDYLGDDATHGPAIENQQRSLQTYMQEYSDRCGPPPSSAKEWANKPLPVPADETAKDVAKSVATAGAAVGVVYVAYRVIRFLPSLFPPFWGTIPANAAIP